MTTQLSVYNNALIILGERKLDSLSENRKPRRVLDTIWNGDFIKECLEGANWNFASRTIRSEYNTAISPDFGYQYAHNKPDDWVRTSAMSGDEYLLDPLQAYNDEAGYWWTNLETVYIKYVSDDADYGSDLAAWPESFTKYAEMKLASKACFVISQSRERAAELDAKAEKLLRNAASKDAQNEPPKFPPTGRLLRARGGGRWRPPTNIRTQ